MRRVFAVLSGVFLTVSLAGSVLAAPTTARNSFTGDFNMYHEGVLLGHVTATIGVPTDQRLVPGTYDFKGAPGFFIREAHATVGLTHFWYDAEHNGGAYVAFFQGAGCDYYGGPESVACSPWAVMFIDNVDPSIPNQVAFSTDGDFVSQTWNFQFWNDVGNGDFTLRFYGAS